jgi:hypothetical protein
MHVNIALDSLGVAAVYAFLSVQYSDLYLYFQVTDLADPSILAATTLLPITTQNLLNLQSGTLNSRNKTVMHGSS